MVTAGIPSSPDSRAPTPGPGPQRDLLSQDDGLCESRAVAKMVQGMLSQGDLRKSLGYFLESFGPPTPDEKIANDHIPGL